PTPGLLEHPLLAEDPLVGRASHDVHADVRHQRVHLRHDVALHGEEPGERVGFIGEEPVEGRRGEVNEPRGRGGRHVSPDGGRERGPNCAASFHASQPLASRSVQEPTHSHPRPAVQISPWETRLSGPSGRRCVLKQVDVKTPEDLPRLFAEAWNRRDPDALASLFELDAEFVNVTGIWWHDRDAIRKAHAYGLSRIFPESTLRIM